MDEPTTYCPDFSELHGMNDAIHTFAKALLQTDQHILFCGIPGTGSALLAKRGAALLGGPFRAPHHTISRLGLTGGVSALTGEFQPGEAHLAAGGVLFLDQSDFIRGNVLKALADLDHQTRIVLHAIPFDGNPVVEGFLARLDSLFGPLLRIDLQVVPYSEMRERPQGPSNAELLKLYATGV